CSDPVPAVRPSEEALVARPDRGLQGSWLSFAQAASDHPVHLVEPVLPAAGPGLHLRLHSGTGAGSVRRLLDRRAFDPGGAAACGPLEYLHLQGPAPDVPSRGVEGAT